jgi:ribosomal protein L17
VTTADEYQRYADECIEWARKAKTDAERKAFLDMALAWTKAGAKATGEALPKIMERPRRDETSH